MVIIQLPPYFKILVVCCLGFGAANNVNSQPLFSADDTMFIRYHPDLTVFIGTPVPNQKLNKDSSARWPNDPFMVDGVLRIKYLVKEWVYGLEKPPDTLEMISYDHYGAFPFLDSKYAMLYVYKNQSGSYIQYRYKYHNVYPTIDGGWAGPPEAWNWFRDSNHLVPRIMPYIDSVRIRMHVFDDSTYFPDELDEIRESYPEPYYYLNRFDMVTMYGNDAKELFYYEKKQLLESAIFDEKYVDENGVVTMPYVDLSSSQGSDEGILPAKPELTQDQFKLFQHFKATFINAVKAGDTARLDALLQPELWVCDSVFDNRSFLRKFIRQIQVPYARYKVRDFSSIKEKNWKAWYENSREHYIVFKDSTGDEFVDKWVHPNFNFSDPRNELFVMESYYPQGDEQNEFFLHFVLRNGQFSLYGMHFTRMRHCYR